MTRKGTIRDLFRENLEETSTKLYSDLRFLGGLGRKIGAAFLKRVTIMVDSEADLGLLQHPKWSAL